MQPKLRETALQLGRMALAALKLWPWGLTLLVVSMVYKLEWLDGQFDVGGMNHWKWKVNIGAVLLAAFWTMWLGRKTRAIVLAALNALLSFLLLSDLVYFRYFKDFISVPVLLQAGQVGELGESIGSLLEPGDWILFADLPIAVLLAAGVLWLARRERMRRAGMLFRRTTGRARRAMLRTVPAVCIFVAGWALIHYPVEEQKNGWARGLFVGNWWNVPIYNVTGLLGFHGYDTYRYAKENWFGGGLSEEKVEEVREWFDDRRQLQRQMEGEPMFGEYKGKNVLVVQAEAFQTFVIGQSIGGEEITPNLNRLIGESLYFPNFYHQTAQGRTSDADFLTSCSMHPMSTGSVFIRFAGNVFDCAPAVLGDEGYDTTVHHAYDGSFWNRNNMYHNMEYDQFYTLKDYTNDEPIGWAVGDRSFFRQTVEQLKERAASPFYALSITLSSHHPFRMPYANQELDVGELRGTIMGDYVQAAHYVDSAVGELVDLLQEDGQWENTVLVFYGDHDNSVNDWSLYEELLGGPVSELDKLRINKQVPFFIHLPNGEYSGVYDKTGGQIDTLPTLMHLLGLPMGNRYMMGVSLLSEAAKPVVFRNGSYTDGTVFYVPGGEGAGGVCYSVPEGEQLPDDSACAEGAEAAKLALTVSDRVIENDLIERFHEEDEEDEEDEE